jgi:hypothetical protein
LRRGGLGKKRIGGSALGRVGVGMGKGRIGGSAWGVGAKHY